MTTVLTLWVVLDRDADIASIAASGKGDVEITGEVRLLAIALEDVAATLMRAHIRSASDAIARDFGEPVPDPDTDGEHEGARALARFIGGAAGRARAADCRARAAA